jgi:hypothetical protein
MSCVRFDRPVCGSNVRSTRGHDGEPRGPCSCIHILIRPTHVHHNPPLSRRYQQCEGEVHTRSPPPKWAQGIGCKGADLRTTSSTIVLPPYRITSYLLSSGVFTVPNDARITVTEAKTTYRLKEEHLVGLDEELKTNPVRRSAPAMRLYLKREVMLAQWEGRQEAP